MNSEPTPEGAGVDAALDAWRRKAADILLAVLAAALLPAAVLVTIGYCPPAALLARVASIGVYLVLCAAALLRGVGYRRRVAASILVLYLASFIALLVNPPGPYAQIGVVALPLYTLVLLSAPAARIATVASSAFIVSVPLLREMPGVIHLLGIYPGQEGEPPNLVWFRPVVEAAFLFSLMVLLSRFHRFLERALAQRIAAQRKMEEEMDERQRLEREIASVGDEERRRLGQELHDGVCQQVTAAMLRCQALERRLEKGGAPTGVDFQAISSLLAETIDDAHNVALGLCPLDPDPEALAPALRALAKQTQETGIVHCELMAAGDVRVPDPAMAQHLYRIAQEALSNAVRHAHANRISLELRRSDSELILLVEDDGGGLPPELPADGMGLRTMAYRARMMGGELEVASAPGGGTRITCRVTRPKDEPDSRKDSGGERCVPAA